MNSHQIITRPNSELLKDEFLTALLRGDSHVALRFTESVETIDQLKEFFRLIVQPAMYAVGQLWEAGDISVTQEHAASAMVSRIMAVLHAKFSIHQPTKGRAIVAATANEYHELGAWIVADMLELDGWEVRYLGANTPLKSIAEMVVRLKPHLLAISITMPANVDPIRKFIDELRHDAKVDGTLILIGGMAINKSPEMWKELGADGYAPDFDSAVIFARNTWDSLPSNKRI